MIEPKALPGFAGMEDEGDLEFANAAGQILGLVQFARFALGALRFQHVDLAHGARRDFVRLCRSAEGNCAHNRGALSRHRPRRQGRGRFRSG